MIKYAIVDDHDIFRFGLKSILNEDHDLKLVFEASSGVGIDTLLTSKKPDVLIIDFQMPGRSGLDILKEIRKSNDTIKVLVLSMHHEEPRILQMIEAGANGYLLKTCKPDELVSAIKHVYKNEYYFNDTVSITMLKSILRTTNKKAKANTTLNENEIKVLKLICEEKTTAEISEQVFLSPRTVEGIRMGMMDKLGVKNVAGLVVYAFRSGIYA
jgi:DNA-binding NarL/FixJ family response regulator